MYSRGEAKEVGEGEAGHPAETREHPAAHTTGSAVQERDGGGEATKRRSTNEVNTWL